MSDSIDNQSSTTTNATSLNIDTPHEALTNTLRPLSDIFLTIRIIKSFTFRTTKNLLLPHIDATTMTVGGLKDLCREQIKTAAGFKPFRNVELDTMKLYTVAHGSKTTNLIINFDNDEEWILKDDSAILSEIGIGSSSDLVPRDLLSSTEINADEPEIVVVVENEAEISFFNGDLYEAFKKDPTQNW